MSQITFTIDTADLASVRALAALVEALYNGEAKQKTTTAAASASQPIPQTAPPAAAPQPMYAPQPAPATPVQQPVYAPQQTPAPHAVQAPTQAPTPAAAVQQLVYAPQPSQAPQTPHTAAPTAIPTAAPTYTPLNGAAPSYTPPAASIPPAAPAPGPLPTSSIAFTRDQLGLAGMQLVEAGQRAELVNLLASFGVEALTQLPDDKLGDFATALRGMGAKL